MSWNGNLPLVVRREWKYGLCQCGVREVVAMWPRQVAQAAKNVAPAFRPGGPSILSKLVLYFCLTLRPSLSVFTGGQLKTSPAGWGIIFFIQTCFALLPYAASLFGVFTGRQLKIRLLRWRPPIFGQSFFRLIVLISGQSRTLIVLKQSFLKGSGGSNFPRGRPISNPTYYKKYAIYFLLPSSSFTSQHYLNYFSSFTSEHFLHLFLYSYFFVRVTGSATGEADFILLLKGRRLLRPGYRSSPRGLRV